jgi:hypothetical protein
VPGSLDKKAKEHATFCPVKDATFFPLFLPDQLNVDKFLNVPHATIR